LLVARKAIASPSSIVGEKIQLQFYPKLIQFPAEASWNFPAEASCWNFPAEASSNFPAEASWNFPAEASWNFLAEPSWITLHFFSK
jgi:hypothetical protein